MRRLQKIPTSQPCHHLKLRLWREKTIVIAQGERCTNGEQNNEVIDPYLIPIEVEDGLRKPTKYREDIRAMGPSVPIPS